MKENMEVIHLPGTHLVLLDYSDPLDCDTCFHFLCEEWDDYDRDWISPVTFYNHHGVIYYTSRRLHPQKEYRKEDGWERARINWKEISTDQRQQTAHGSPILARYVPAFRRNYAAILIDCLGVRRFELAHRHLLHLMCFAKKRGIWFVQRTRALPPYLFKNI